MNIDIKVITEIIKISEGDMRKILNLLQNIYLTGNTENITVDNLY